MGARPRRAYPFPGAVTVLALVTVLVWVAALFIPAGRYALDADGAPIAGSYVRVESPLTFGERLIQLILSPVNGVYGVQEPGTGFVDTENVGRLFGSIGVVVFMLAMGAFISVGFATRSLEVAVGLLAGRMRERGWLLIVAVMTLFSLLGSTMGFSVEAFGFFALLMPLMSALGYDRMVTAGMIILGALTGAMASTVNPFSTGVASGEAGVSIGDGIVLRVLLWVVLTALAIGYVLRYAGQVRKDRSRSLVGFDPPPVAAETTAEIGTGYFQETHPQELFREASVYAEYVAQPSQMPHVLEIAMRTAIEKRGVAVVVIPGDVALADASAADPLPDRLDGVQKSVLAIFGGTFALLIYSVIPWSSIIGAATGPAEYDITHETAAEPFWFELGWWFPELSMLFLFAAVLVGVVARMGEKQLVKLLSQGMSDMLGPALVIVLARGVAVIMNNTETLDTVLFAMERVVSGASAGLFAILVTIVNAPLAFLVPSSSGHATLAMPLLAPLGDFAGVDRALVITSFQLGHGFMLLFSPTNVVVVGGLAIAGIGYDTYLRFVAPFLALVFVVVCVVLGAAASFG